MDEVHTEITSDIQHVIDSQFVYRYKYIHKKLNQRISNKAEPTPRTPSFVFFRSMEGLRRSYGTTA